jgi:hypothetical protein
MAAISGSFMPRVVTAGVPSRMPLAWNGERVSNGNGVLVHRDAGDIERNLAFLAGHILRAHVHQHQMIVRAAADEPETVALHALGQRAAFLTICF